MKPTAEQHAVLNATGRMVRINARAGTGKTTTLAMLAQKYKKQRLLYLVFNRKAMEEAKTIFPSNTEVRTVHSLAYKGEGYKWKETLGHFSPADMLFAFPEAGEQLLATLSHDFLVFFLNSPYHRLEEAVKPFQVYLPEHSRSVLEFYQPRIVQAARDLATAWNTGQKSCPHDFYLKLFHKSRQFHQALSRYDLILVDEGQDLSEIMLDALRTCQQRIVLVGDSHQQIYSFRYAVDAMRKLPCDEEFELTLSFRFGEAIADLASVFIQEAKQVPQFRIQGNQKRHSQVEVYHRIPHAAQKQKTAMLSRSNVALFENAMSFRSGATPFTFERDLYPLLMRTLDVYWLAQEHKEKIRDHLIRTFHTLDELGEYAKTTDNFQLQGMIEIVEKYQEEFPGVIFEMADLCKSREKQESQEKYAPRDGIILSTIHSAKGQEYDHVYIDKDLAETLDAVKKHDAEAGSDEMNVAYVGFTRAKEHLHLPPELQDVLTPRWSRLVEQYHPQYDDEQGYQPPEIGDRVFTSHGPGTILEISGEYCLIDIAPQKMKIRERVANLRLTRD